MWLQNFLHAKPVVDFDADSGQFRLVGVDELPDGVPLVDSGDKLLGSYLDESDEIHTKYGSQQVVGAKKFFLYWMPERTHFYFQDSSGARIEIDGRRYATLEEAEDVAGNPIDGHMQFSIFEPDGQLLYRHIYDQSPYMKAYMMDFSFPEPELGDWDFFVTLKGSFDYMQKNAHKHHSAVPADDSSISRVSAGELASRSGWWFTPAKQSSRRYFKQGDVFPKIEGRAYGATFWQWSPDQSDPKI